MSQVVIVISAMLMADLREARYVEPGASEIVATCERHGATISAASATMDPERETTGYMTIVAHGDVSALAAELREIGAVSDVFVKPATELP